MMERLRSIAEFRASGGGTVASIGNFDGVHVAHQHVLRNVVSRAKEMGGRSLVITFDPHPSRVLRPESAPKLILATQDKLRFIEEMGIDAAIVIPFDRAFSETAGEEFCRALVFQALVREVHEGANFRFGRGAATDVLCMQEIGSRLGFNVVVYPEERVRGEVVSSSRIRQLIAAGRMNVARHLLGRAFFVRSTPAHGRGIGSRLTVPTINLAKYDELLPANGVYVTALQLDGRKWKSVTNVGMRPTFGAESFAVESHILDFEPVELQETTPLKLTFLHRLREERRFADAAELKRQILHDVKRAERWFESAQCADVDVRC